MSTTDAATPRDALHRLTRAWTALVAADEPDHVGAWTAYVHALAHALDVYERHPLPPAPPGVTTDAEVLADVIEAHGPRRSTLHLTVVANLERIADAMHDAAVHLRGIDVRAN